MSTTFGTVQVGERVLGEYQVTHLVGHDAAYEYVVAERDHVPHHLQLLHPDVCWSDACIQELFAQFDAIQNVSAKRLYRPSLAAADTRFRAAFIYRDLPPEAVTLPLPLSQARAFLEEACEAGHTLYNKRIVHGAIVPPHWGQRDGVQIVGWGYAPLLNPAFAPHKIAETLKSAWLAFLPPVLRQAPTTAGDVYGLIYCLGQFLPLLAGTKTYKDALAAVSSGKTLSPRALWTLLEPAISALEAADIPEATGATDTRPGLIPKPAQTGAIIPRYTILAESEPQHAGNVMARASSADVWKPVSATGENRFPAQTVLLLRAQATHGWQFHEWGGSVQGKEADTTLTVHDECRIYARFAPVAAASFPARTGGMAGNDAAAKYIVRAAVEPEGAGRVSGGGVYVSGQSVVLHAQANPGYRFVVWKGFAAGTGGANAAEAAKPRLPLKAEVVPSALVAQFEPLPLVTVRLESEPSHAGTVRGGGNVYEDALLTLIAEPNAGWQFSGWSGLATGTAPEFDLRAQHNGVATAHFAPVSREARPGAKPGGEAASGTVPPRLASSGSLGQAFAVSQQPNAKIEDAEDTQDSDRSKTAKRSLGKAFE